MNRKKINEALNRGNIEWSAHALKKMLERGISRNVVKEIILQGEIIESYPDDRPFPSALLFGTPETEPIHAVIAFDEALEKIYLITAYIPDNEHFQSDYKTRKKNDA